MMKRWRFVTGVLVFSTLLFPLTGLSNRPTVEPGLTPVSRSGVEIRPKAVGLKKTQVATAVQSVHPNRLELQAGAKGRVVTLKGQALDKVTAVQLLQQNRPVKGVSASLQGAAKANAFTVYLSATKHAQPGNYQLKILAGRKTVVVASALFSVQITAPKSIKAVSPGKTGVSAARANSAAGQRGAGKEIQGKPSATAAMQGRSNGSAPQVRSVSPKMLTLTGGAPATTVTLKGSNLNRLTTVRVLRNNTPVNTVQASLQKIRNGMSRQLQLSAMENTPAGTYSLQLLVKGGPAVTLSPRQLAIRVTPPSQVVLEKKSQQVGATAGLQQGRMKTTSKNTELRYAQITHTPAGNKLLVPKQPDLQQKVVMGKLESNSAMRMSLSLDIFAPVLGEELCMGASHTARWGNLAGDDPGLATLVLLKNDGTEIVLEPAIQASSMSSPWTVPNRMDCVAEGNYRLRLRDRDNAGLLSEESAGFQIKDCGDMMYSAQAISVKCGATASQGYGGFDSVAPVGGSEAPPAFKPLGAALKGEFSPGTTTVSGQTLVAAEGGVELGRGDNSLYAREFEVEMLCRSDEQFVDASVQVGDEDESPVAEQLGNTLVFESVKLGDGAAIQQVCPETSSGMKSMPYYPEVTVAWTCESEGAARYGKSVLGNYPVMVACDQREFTWASYSLWKYEYKCPSRYVFQGSDGVTSVRYEDTPGLQFACVQQ